MAGVYLDANILIDITKGRGNKALAESFNQHQIYISPLSTHILFYSQKIKVPNSAAAGTVSQFETIDLTKDIQDKALNGPTSDFEDNIQLHSAAEAECDTFLTNDKKLLKMAFFGKTRIASSLNI